MSRPEWAPATRQEQGRYTEKRILKERGARVHPMSGAGDIKADGSDEDYLYEVKDANKQFVLRSDELRKLQEFSAVAGKEPVMLIYFTEGDFTVRVEIERTRGRAWGS